MAREDDQEHDQDLVSERSLRGAEDKKLLFGYLGLLGNPIQPVYTLTPNPKS